VCIWCMLLVGRRPFEQHIDSWLQMADTEAQQEAQIAHYKDVFNQMDLNSKSSMHTSYLHIHTYMHIHT
jgi:hypothetical protein